MASSTLFTWGPANVDSLLATTQSVLAKTKDFLNDAIFNSIPLLQWLEQNDRVKRQGGASILVPLMYGKNSTFKGYSKDDVFDTTGQEGLTMAQAKWVNYGGTITIFGDEMRQNAGEGKLFDLVKAKTMQATMSGRDALAIDLFLSSVNSKKVLPLDTAVDTTSTVQDINSTTNSWWQAQAIASGSFAARGPADLRNLRDTIIKQGQSGAAAPSLIITTQLISELYEQANAQSIRYGPRDEADLSFSGLKFSTAMVKFDPNCATGNLYMLSPEAMSFVVHSDADWSIGDFKEPVDQDVRTAKVIWMGNLVINNRRRLGKLTGITA